MDLTRIHTCGRMTYHLTERQTPMDKTQQMLEMIKRVVREQYPADITDDGYANIAEILNYFMDGGDMEGLAEDYAHEGSI